MDTVDYQITPDSLVAHRFRVACTLAAPDPSGQLLSMAAWIPGSYVIRDFARHVLSVTARNPVGEVAVTKRDKQTWHCAPCAGPLTVVCEVYAFDASVRAAYLDDRRGFFNGTSVFLRPHGFEQLACRLRIDPAPAADWTVATSLPAEDVDASGFGDYRAPNYANLIDHPVAMGRIRRVAFEAAGVPHVFAQIGRGRADEERLAADLKRVCETHADLFGELPVSRYLFLTHIAAEGYGGLEHADCSALVAPRHALPVPGAEARDDAYVDLLGLCSHEYFHLWNVKRIRPQGVADSDLAAEVHFSDLWAYEGVTAYYDDLALLRGGLIEPETYLKRLERAATRLDRTPGRKRQTLAESSFDAWTKFYRQDENSPNAIVSYYGKGALFSLCLDLTLRLESNGRMSLDSIMREVWRRYGVTDTPVPDGGLEALVCELCDWPAKPFFDRYLRGTEALPLAALLEEFGIDCSQQARQDDEAVLAAQGLRIGGESTRLKSVLDGSPAQSAGLCPGDRIVAVAGLEVTADNLAKRLRRLPVGDSVTLHFFREDELLDCRVQLRSPPADSWQFALDEQVSAPVRARRDAWLHGRAEAPAAVTPATG